MKGFISILGVMGILMISLACDDGGSGSVGGQMGEGGNAGNMENLGGNAMVGGDQNNKVKPFARFELDLDVPMNTKIALIPFPNEIYLSEGKIQLKAAFSNPLGIFGKLLDNLRDETKGFGTSSSLYTSFNDAIDTSLLPQDGGDSLLDNASLSIIDIDPQSPEKGKRYPISWKYYEDATKYLPAHSLAIRLLEGINLRSSTTYALIISDQIAQSSELFNMMLLESAPTDPKLSAIHAIYQPLRDFMKANPNKIPKLSNASVFKTQDATSEMFQARDFIHTLDRPIAREIRSVSVQDGREDFEIFDGRYSAPKFQEGTIPYQTEGGAIRFDDQGHPIIQGEEDLRFSMAVPLEQDMPEEGWPLVLYAHGTGGNYQSYFREGIADVLVRQGLAVISMDQIHHGERDGGVCDQGDYSSCVSLLFFNFLVPLAGRDNVRQSALDLVSLMRMSQTLEIPSELSQRQRSVKINPNKILFMGHSQGGLNGPIFLAIESEVKGGMLSGAGSNIAISIEQKTKPIDINRLVKIALGLPNDEVLDRWHPALAVLQMFIDVGDGSNFGRFWFDSPRMNYQPKSIFMTAGLLDDYTPPDAIFALAVSGRVPLIEPVYQEIDALNFLNIPSAGVPPFSGNVADRKATAGLAQYPDQGHFVIYDLPSAKERYSKFLKELANSPLPKIY